MNIGNLAKTLFSEMSAKNQVARFYEMRFSFPLNSMEILKKVQPGGNIEDLLYDKKGHRRYYADPIVENGESFLLCNHWYPKNEQLLADIASFANISVRAVLSKVEKQVDTTKRKKRSGWPAWQLPSDTELLSLARTLTKYTVFLSPAIVRRIVEDNVVNSKIWCDALHRKDVNPDIYLWPRSSCAFPGIRRYQGRKEIATYRKRPKFLEPIANALELDDNDYPKHLWSFVFRGKQFQKMGPNGYSLAHLCDHKEYKNRSFQEFQVTSEGLIHPLCGLYTCASNTIYTPTSLLKPTDYSSRIRKLLIKKAIALYGDFCNLTPDWLKIMHEDDGEWAIGNFSWAEPVGTIDNVEDFLEYRRNVMSKLLE